MTDNVFSNLHKQPRSAFALTIGVNKLAGATLKLTEFQLRTLTAYWDLGVKRLEAASKLGDVQGLYEFYAGQVKTAGVLWQKMIQDASTLLKLSAEAAAAFRAVMTESRATLASVHPG